VSSKTRTSHACFWSGRIRRPHTALWKTCRFLYTRPRSDPCLTRCTTFRTGAGPAYSPLLGHEEGPAHRVPPHLESFLAQLAVPVKCAVRSFSSNLPSWSRSVWWPAFLRHASPVLCCAPRSIYPASPGVSNILLPLRHAVMISLCGPFGGSSSPRGGTRVPFHLVGDVVGV